ncbi:MAG: succinylglutamate desuccinylase/aspartoacylase family protein [Burkholderiales bacterium]|nr:MAG: succinylglutamate desuccinylase/aspartoacylase family protein [Burkholderiales bacterium]
MKPIEVGTAVSTAPGVSHGSLNVGALPDGSPVDIPVIIVRGAADGPTLWLHGCVHGNEYCGTFIIHEFIRRLDPAQLSGTVVALPVLNRPAFQKNQRMSPFEGMGGGDLNRCFPGRADGSVTEQMGHAIYTALRQHADYLVDFHTAFTADTRWALFADLGGEVSKKGLEMARAFGFAHTLPAPKGILVGSSMMTAGAEGIPSFNVEAGGMGPAFTPEVVEDGAERLLNVARQLGLLAGAVHDYGPLVLFSNFHWVCATQAGLYQPLVACGQKIEAGQVVGRYFDVFGESLGDAVAPSTGIALAVHPGPIMARGETLIHIGLDPRGD